MSERVVWINGDWLTEREAKISIYDLSIMQAAAAFTMCRSFRQKIFKLGQHLDRLQNSCTSLGLPFPIGRRELENVCDEIVERNQPVFDKDDEHRLLIVASPGCAPMYKGFAGAIDHPYVYIADFPLRHTVAGLGRQFVDGGSAVVTTVLQVPDASIPSQAKHRSRLHFYLAQEEAKRRKVDWAIMCDNAGDLAECPGANIFIVLDGVLFAPLTEALPGISRAYVLELAESLGLPIAKTHRVTLDDLADADEVFVSGTPFCILPLRIVDGIEYDCPGPVYRELLSAWSAKVGVDIARQIALWDAELEMVHK